jgi:two-component system LytT family response regulator
MKLIIIEDEAPSQRILKRMLEDEFPAIEIAGIADEIATGIQLIKVFQPDIVLLDIEVNGENALEAIASAFPTPRSFELIMTTAYEHYAIDAFQAAAIDYLLKPIDQQRFKKSILRARTQLALRQSARQLSGEQYEPDEKVTLNTASDMTVFSKSQVLYAEADRAYSSLYLTNGHHHILSRPLSDIEAQLSDDRFMRIHRSYVVNLHHVVRLIKSPLLSLELTNGKRLPVATRRKADLVKLLR